MILFLGNMLSKHGLAPAMTELLAKKLSESYAVATTSSRRNAVLRFIDMLFSIFWNRKRSSLVVIDIFSTTAFWYGVACAYFLRMLSVPYLTILRGGDLPNRLKTHHGFSKIIFDNAQANVSPSVYLERAFSAEGFSTEIIPNFIDLERYAFYHRVQVRPRLLWVRSFHQTYNPGLAVEVLRRMCQRYPDAELCMVGPEKDDSLRDVKNLVDKYQLHKQIRFTGRLSKEEWIKESINYDIFINTTNFDNMPVSVLEAMALGFPVISTRVGGIPDLIEDGSNGEMVDPNDAQAFVDKIEALVADPVRTSALSRGARTFAESFSWEAVRPRWDELIRSTARV